MREVESSIPSKLYGCWAVGKLAIGIAFRGLMTAPKVHEWRKPA